MQKNVDTLRMYLNELTFDDVHTSRVDSCFRLIFPTWETMCIITYVHDFLKHASFCTE